MTSLDLPDTPRLAFQSLAGPEHKIDFVRSEVIANFAVSIPEIPFDLFEQAVLPSVQESSVEEAYRNLRKWDILTDYGWKGIRFYAGDEEETKVKEEEEEEVKVKIEAEAKGVGIEKKKKEKESLFYAPLFEGLNTIMGVSPAVKFSTNPDKSLFSEGDHSHYKADINGLLTKTTAVPPTNKGAEYECDVVMTGELKKKSTPDDIDDNNKKVLSNATHILGSDPKRRFMFGLTIDKLNFRLWFFSRSHVFVTEAMNLHTDAKSLIHLALSLSGACQEELGYDPTVARVQSKNGPRYIFTIKGERYLTTELITVRKAKFLLGRATRIFKAQKVLRDEGNTYILDDETKVIKDCWLPEDSLTELETRSAIQKTVQKVNNVPNLDEGAFDAYFVKIEACEKVLVLSMKDPKTQSPDSSSNFLRGRTLSSDVKRFKISASSPTYQRAMSVSIPGSILMESESERQQRQEIARQEATAAHLARLGRGTYTPKVHCRLLSEYAGEPLDQLTDWGVILKALGSLIIALSYMHSAGFVHRDISIANVLVKDGNTKLNDLEYSKRVEPKVQPRSGTSDVKTGTRFFMPFEVITGEWEFIPRPQAFSSQPAPSFPFRYHYLHDLESVLWVFIYLLTTKWPADELPPSEEQLQARDEFFSSVFVFGKREELLVGKAKMFSLAAKSTLPRFHLDWTSAFNFAKSVMEKHCELQKSLPIDFGKAFHPSLYSDWQKAFDCCAIDGWAGKVVHCGHAKRPAEADSEKRTKKSKVTQL